VLDVERLPLQLGGVGEEQVEHGFCIGLDVARKTTKPFVDGSTIFFLEVLEDDVLAIGDHHEKVPLLAGLAALLVTVDGLHAYAGGIGRDAERGRKRVLAHGPHNRSCECVADELFPTRKRAAIDGEPVARERILEPKQGQPFADVLHDDVGGERGGGHAARQHLVRHRRRDDVGTALGVDGLVANAGDYEPNPASAPVSELVRIVEAMSYDLTFGDQRFEMWVWYLDALLVEHQVLEVSTACAAVVRTPAARLSVARGRIVRLGVVTVRDSECAGECVELTQLLLELDSKLLLVVSALGLRDEQAALEQRHLMPKSLVRRAQLVAFGLEFCDALRGPLALQSRCFAFGIQQCPKLWH